MKKTIIGILVIIVGLSLGGCASSKIERLKGEAEVLLEQRNYGRALVLYEEIVRLDDSNEENILEYERIDYLDGVSKNINRLRNSMDKYDKEIGSYNLGLYLNDEELFKSRLISQQLYIEYCTLLYNRSEDEFFKDLAIEEYYNYSVLLDVFYIDKLSIAESFMNYTKSQIALGGLRIEDSKLRGIDVLSGLAWVFSKEFVDSYPSNINYEPYPFITYALRYYEGLDELPEELEELHELSKEIYEEILTFSRYVHHPTGLSKYYEEINSSLDSIYRKLTIKQQQVQDYEKRIGKYKSE